MLDLLISDHRLPPTIRQLASATLSHAEGRGQLLGPESRDRLLRRLAVIPADDERVDPILVSLTDFPIRDGGALIAQIAVDQTLPIPIRISAIDVLGMVSDREAVQMAVATVECEPPGNVLEFLVELAAKRQVSVRREWLEARIEAASDPFNRRALLGAYQSRTVCCSTNDNSIDSIRSKRSSTVFIIGTPHSRIQSPRPQSRIARIVFWGSVLSLGEPHLNRCQTASHFDPSFAFDFRSFAGPI